MDFLTFTEGDTAPALSGYTSRDLTGYTVTLQMKRPTTLLEKIATPTFDAGASLWRFSWTWSSLDLVAGQSQRCDLVFTDAGGKVATTARFMANVVAKLT